MKRDDVKYYAEQSELAYQPSLREGGLNPVIGDSWFFEARNNRLVIVIMGTRTMFSMQQLFNAVPYLTRLFSLDKILDLPRLDGTVECLLYKCISRYIVKQAINWAEDNKIKFVGIDIAGHSRGGLIAVYCGWIALTLPTTVRIFTYGTPMMICTLPDAVKAVWIAVVHVQDYIVSFTRWWIGSYHPNHFILLTNEVKGATDGHSVKTYVTGISAETDLNWIQVNFNWHTDTSLIEENDESDTPSA